jgi:hypothetical protein
MSYRYITDMQLDTAVRYYGDFAFGEYPKAVILNSRQSKTPAGNHPWIQGTVNAAKEVAAKGYTLLTGIGMNTWELALWAASANNSRQIIIIATPSFDRVEALIANINNAFNLDKSRTGWLFYQGVAKARSAKANWPTRDRLALTAADFILPVSIRPHGNLEALIQQAQEAGGRRLIDGFRVDYQPEKQVTSFDPDKAIAQIGWENWDFIIHWTRSCYGPWPGQSAAEFYASLTSSGNSYPSNGLATLRRIISEGVIRASAKNHRERLRAVAFSSLHPADIVPLMRWRKRFVRWNFEPYGIAIARETAIAAGIQPAIYGPADMYDRLLDTDKPYFQAEGDAGIWREEKEWRHIGDFGLEQIPLDQIRLIVFKPEEVAMLNEIGKYRIIALT